jgi:hypothetical protein
MHADGLNGAQTGVHSAYEEKMVDSFAGPLAQKLAAFDVTTLGPKVAKPKSGHEAGATCVQLMRRCRAALPPEQICQVYNGLGGGKSKPVIAGLWAQLQDPTVRCIADGARTPAALYQTAHDCAAVAAFTGAAAKASLKTCYEKKTFLPSLHLMHLDQKDYPVPAQGDGEWDFLTTRWACSSGCRVHAVVPPLALELASLAIPQSTAHNSGYRTVFLRAAAPPLGNFFACGYPPRQSGDRPRRFRLTLPENKHTPTIRL